MNHTCNHLSTNSTLQHNGNQNNYIFWANKCLPCWAWETSFKNNLTSKLTNCVASAHFNKVNLTILKYSRILTNTVKILSNTSKILEIKSLQTLIVTERGTQILIQWTRSVKHDIKERVNAREKDFMQQEIRESLRHCQEELREKEQLQGPLSQINKENLSSSPSTNSVDAMKDCRF